ncbi:MAG: signal recognition particle protein [Nitrospirae bacterium]|nr:signal recognition particle protein [Nitrospirota bacterium]MBF0540799.1 signal recognition particle protein [Nitrospirota bacterium]
MFNSLNEKLESIFKKLKSRGFLNVEDIDVAMKEIRLSLLEADVNFKVVKKFIDAVKAKAIGNQVLESLTPGQQVVKIVNDELCFLLGEKSERIFLSPNPPTIIMMIGLNGSGKTTTSAKLANYFKTQGRRPLLVASDLQRPAAIDQLITLGKQINVPVYFSKEEKDPVKLSNAAISIAKKDANDIVIIDTAGRLHIDKELMEELARIKKGTNPTETLLIADAMTGQDAVNIAKDFNDQIGLNGIILTKMDGDARGGAALSMREVTGTPIKFMGTGEKIEMLEPFHPDRVANRILGMGDVLSLIEKAQQNFDQDDAISLQKKIMGEGFDFEDLLEQISKIRSMGPIENLLSMIPGANKLKGINIDERQFTKIEAIISSMTRSERRNPKLLSGRRKIRIATGSGTRVSDVNALIKQLKEMKKMFKMFKGGRGFKMPNIMPF